LNATELWRQCRENPNDDARAALINHYTPLVKTISASLYARRPDDEVEFDEFFQLGLVGLVESVDRYDLNSNATFETYASYRIRGSILNGLEKMTERREQSAYYARLRKERMQSIVEEDSDDQENNLFEEMVEVALGMAICYMLEDTGMVRSEAENSGDHVYQMQELLQLKERLIEAVDCLPEREHMIIEYHYFKQVSFIKIAEILSLTKGRVSQLHKRALLLLREELNKKQSLEGYF